MRLLHTKPGEFPAGIEAQVCSLLREAFPDDRNERCCDGPEPPALVVLLLNDQSVIGHLAAYAREVRLGTQKLTLGLIGDVAVAAPFRRRGHARTKLAEAHSYFLSRRIPFSALFANEPMVYRSSGYREMRNKTRFLDRDARWKEFVYRGAMVAELAAEPWRSHNLDLCSPTV
jgi:predicted acetyltransferase